MINKIRKNVKYVIIMNDRNYQKKKNIVEKFIKKNKTIDHSKILNEIDVDYDTLMRILSDLRSEGKVS
jgi:hypothetical protein